MFGRFIILAGVLLCPGLLHSQPVPAGMQKQLDELKARIKSLESENERLKCNTRAKDSLLYCTMRNEIFNAFSNISRLNQEFKNTSEKIAVTGLFTKLMQASNPTSDILGFRFTEIIFSAAEKHFLSELKNENDRRRFSQVISKIVSNPIVNTLANTNPVTSVVSGIVSTIAAFSTPKVELERESGKIKDVRVVEQDAFDHRSIDAFRGDLQVYIDFYDAMITTSDEYLRCSEEMNLEYLGLKENIRSMEEQMLSRLHVEESNLLIKLSGLMPDPSINDLDFSELILDPCILDCYGLAAGYPVMQSEVRHFIQDYNLMLNKFLNDYIRILQLALSFPEKDIDKTKTRLLITDIETFILQQVQAE